MYRRDRDRRTLKRATGRSLASMKDMKIALAADRMTSVDFNRNLRQSKIQFAKANHELKYRADFRPCVRLPRVRGKPLRSLPAPETKSSTTYWLSFSVEAAFYKAVI